MLRRSIALAGVTMLALAVMSGTASAADNRGIHICLKGTRACLDLKSDSFAPFSNVVWLSGPKGNGLGWQKQRVGTVCNGVKCGKARPFAAGTGLNKKYAGRPIYVFWKSRGTKRDGCIVDDGGDGVAFTADWTKVARGKGNSWCGGSGKYGYKGLWVYSSKHYIVSVGFSFDDRGAVQPGIMSTTSKATDTIIDLSNPGDEAHEKWTL